MGGLMAAIPGLAAHNAEIPEPVIEIPEFDFERQFDILRAAVAEVCNTYPDGAWEWLAENRPEIRKALLDHWNSVDEAFETCDVVLIRPRVEAMRAAHAKAWRIYRERPPVMERQDSLLDEAV
jgi:hypothetical protein